MTDYDDVRYCCNEANICLKCWRLMTIAIKFVDECLRNDSGFHHLWVAIIGTEPATLRTPLMSSSNTISYFMKTTKPNFSICILSTSDCVTMKTTRALGELCVGATTA